MMLIGACFVVTVGSLDEVLLLEGVGKLMLQFLFCYPKLG